MWVVVKIVDNKVYLVVGPFLTEGEAKLYSEQCLVGSLGYEKWDVWKTERPNF